MAKKEEANKIVLERTYNVPLRREFLKAPNWKRTPKAVRALKAFLVKHMKSDNVSIGKFANQELWKHGMKKPPHHIKVNVTKDSEGVVIAELVGAPTDHISEPKKKRVRKQLEKEKKAEGKKDIKKDVKSILKGDKKLVDEFKKEESLEKQIEDKKEEIKEKAKEIEKEELKEIKKEPVKESKPVAVEKKVEQHANAPMKK